MRGLDGAGAGIFVTGLTMTAIATIAVILLVITRKHQPTKAYAEEFWLFVALISFHGYFAVSTWGLVAQDGTHDTSNSTDINPVGTTTYLKSTVPYLVLFAVSNTSVKFSAIFLYRRIFPTKVFQQISLGVLAVCGLWLVVVTINWPLICRPLDLFRSSDPSSPEGTCYHVNAYFMGIELSNILLDHVVLALPLPMVWKLQMPKRQKILVCGMFMFGTFACITALIRLCVMFEPNGFYLAFGKGQIWSSIHLSAAITCACMPSYRPLIVKIGAATQIFRKRYLSRFSSGLGSGSSSGSDKVSSGRRASTPGLQSGSLDRAAATRQGKGVFARFGSDENVNGTREISSDGMQLDELDRRYFETKGPEGYDRNKDILVFSTTEIV